MNHTPRRIPSIPPCSPPRRAGRRLILLLLFALLSVPAMSQERMSWDEFVEYVYQWNDFSSAEDEQTESMAWTEHLEDLQQLTLNPININTASREELLALPFLSEVQASDIHEYVVRYHGMHTLYELQLIPSIRPFERKILPLFVYAGTTRDFLPQRQTLADLLKQHRHELLTRIDIPLYHREGFLRQEGGYRGSRIYNKVKYDFTASKHIRLNLHAERDAGERGIDSYGGAFMLKDFGHLATFVAGDFKVGFGEGLVLNQSFSMGKSATVSRSSQGLKVSGSTDEMNFMRGVGTTLRFGDVNITAFLSRRKWDATLSGDTAAKTIVTGGYHRTDTEYGKRGNLTTTVAGSNLSWHHGHWHAGATAYYLHTSLPLQPGTQLYRAIYPTGSDFVAMGISYGYEAYRWLMRGECAYSTQQGGIATLNSLSLRLTPRYRLTASQRYYNRHYYSFFASATSENGKVQNETAASLRLDATPFDGCQLTAYADYFYNPWPRYGLTHSSSGMEGVLITQYNFNRKSSLAARYSFKNKEYSSGIQSHHRLRLQWQYQPGRLWKWQTTAMLHTVQGSSGMALGQTLRYAQGTSAPLRFSLSAIYFHTDDYNSRISLYEPNVVGTMSLPSFYGHGIRLAGTLQWAVWQHRLRFELKYGITDFFDRDTQSSALQTIYSNVKNDITLQMRLRI